MTRATTAVLTCFFGGIGLGYFLNNAWKTGLAIWMINIVLCVCIDPAAMMIMLVIDLLGLMRMSEEEFRIRYQSGKALEGLFILPRGSKKQKIDFKKLNEAEAWLKKGEPLICLGELTLLKDDPQVRKLPYFWNIYLPAMAAVVTNEELYKSVYEATEEGVSLPLFNEKVKAIALRIEAERLEAKRRLAAVSLVKDGMSPLRLEEKEETVSANSVNRVGRGTVRN
jgi:hypothetical protein